MTAKRREVKAAGVLTEDARNRSKAKSEGNCASQEMSATPEARNTRFRAKTRTIADATARLGHAIVDRAREDKWPLGTTAGCRGTIFAD